MRRPADTRAFTALSEAIHTMQQTPVASPRPRVEITGKQRLALLKVLMELAPDDHARQRVLRSANEANADGQGAKYVACAIVDGILYGNWPWVL